MIQKVRDYTTKETFLENINEKLKPIVDAILDEIWKKDDFKTLRLRKILTLSFTAFFILFLIISVFVITTSSTAALALSIIDIILLISAVVSGMFWLWKRRDIKYSIQRALNIHQLYKLAFSLLNANIQYINEDIDKDIYKLMYKDMYEGIDEDIDENIDEDSFPSLSQSELSLHNSLIRRGYDFFKSHGSKKLVLHSKHNVCFECATWIKEVVVQDKTISTSYAYTTVIKIDTSQIRDPFDFFMSESSLFDFSNYAGMKKIKLENSNFNKEFNMRAYNELKTFQMLTPLAMENMVQRKMDNNGVDVKDLKILSTGNFLYIGFVTRKEEVFRDRFSFFLTLKKEVMSQRIVDEISQAVYNIYYPISIMQIPIYID